MFIYKLKPDTEYPVLRSCENMNNLVTCVLLVTLLVVAGSYNSDDEYYNHLTSSHLEDTNRESSAVFARNRREASEEDDSKRKRISLCCADELFESIHQNENEIMKTCYKEVTGKDAPTRLPKFNHEDIACIMECAGQKLNVIDSNGNLREAEYTKYFKDKLAGTSYLVPIQDKILAEILKDVKNVSANSDKSCKPTGAILTHSFFKNIQLNCPEENIKDKDACSRLQERLKKPHNL